MLPALPSTTTTRHLHLDNSSHNSGSTQHSPSGSTTPKRSSSMIFRIEHLLPLPPPTPTTTPTTTPSSTPKPTPTAITSSVSPLESVYNLQTTGGISIPATPNPPNNGVQKRSKLNRSPGVYLKHFAPKDTVSETIPSLALMSSSPSTSTTSTTSSSSSSSSSSQQTTRTYCSIMQNTLHITPTIMRRVKLSEDIHSYNALFELFNGDVRLRIVRDIARDEELIAWFDEEVTLLMSIPFLTPTNIQGNNRYTCHICHLSFETPNPLKIHLALACGRHTLDILWIRLHYTLKSSALSQQNLPLRLMHHHSHHSHHSHHQHHPPPAISPAHRSPVHITSCSSITIPTISPVSSSENQRLSAFKPIISSSSSSSSSSNVVSSTSSSMASNNILPITSSSLNLPIISHSTTTALPFLPTISSAATLSSMSILHPPHANNPLNAAAQIEAIVSNMGASKQGHLCIYCGKVYSRKYGLKIHIRTHTGFKPLKCKFCLRPFGDPSNLNKHVRLHLQSNSNSNANSNSGEPSVEGYKCHMCHKTLARRRDLQRHIESRHSTAS